MTKSKPNVILLKKWYVPTRFPNVRHDKGGQSRYSAIAIITSRNYSSKYKAMFPQKDPSEDLSKTVVPLLDQRVPNNILSAIPRQSRHNAVHADNKCGRVAPTAPGAS